MYKFFKYKGSGVVTTVQFCYLISADICSSSPCQNNGSCVVNGSSGYLCKCQPGYSGPYCESKRKYCIQLKNVFNQNL